MRLPVEIPTGYVDTPTKRRLERLGFQATGQTRRMHQMRHSIQTIEVASMEELERFLRDYGATWDGYGPIQLGRGGDGQ